MELAPVVQRDIVIDEEPFVLVVTTHHEGAVATTAIHKNDFEHHIGGARFVESAEGLEEVGHLSSTMTEKCMAAMIPADGQKSVIVTGSATPPSEETRAAILIDHVRFLKGLDPGVIVGPDMNNPESVQDRASRAEGLLDHFTGLSEAAGGLSIDTYGYTAQGLVAAIRACIDDAALAHQRISIQGFGAVGAHTARLVAELGAKVVAVNTKDVLLVDRNGLDVPALFARWREHGDEGLNQLTGEGISREPNEIFRVPTDIFVPAARTGVLAMADELPHVRETENHDVRDVADFHAATGVRLIVEGANHPISTEAEHWLESKGVRVLPDFIVNCGGLIGCWVEWEARHRDGQHSSGNLHAIGQRALEHIRTTVTNNVKELLAAKMPARDAAQQIVRRNREKLLEQRMTNR
jgi:glutamate dehydrogenase (NAD(P)+)